MMKKRISYLTKTAFIGVFLIGLFNACSMDEALEFTSDDVVKADVKETALVDDIKVTTFTEETLPPCEECVDEVVVYNKLVNDSFSWSNPAEITIYNTSEELVFNFEVEGASYSWDLYIVEYWVNGVYYMDDFEIFDGYVKHQVNHPLPFDYTGCQIVFEKFRVYGINASNMYEADVNYGVYEFCPAGPGNPRQQENRLTTTLRCNTWDYELDPWLMKQVANVAEIQFVSKEPGYFVIQGTVGPQASIITSYSNFFSQSNVSSGQGNSNSNHSQWEGYLEAGQRASITIVFRGSDRMGAWTAKKGNKTVANAQPVRCGDY